MKYDLFISHASEDKGTVVRELSRGLRSRRLAVWYDEFALRVGDGLRKSIDEGLSQSRFGVVVLSPAFFAKRWTSWELDGLIQRHVNGENVILPVWHNVNRDEVAEYSPSLANIVAVSTSDGVDAVVSSLVAAIRPEKSTLEVAHDLLVKYGVRPPPISDDWWLHVVRESAWPYTLADPWRFEPPPKPEYCTEDAWELAWAAMAREWTEEARYRQLSCTDHPAVIAHFIEEQPGLREVASLDARALIRHVPQFTIPGLGSPFESSIQALYVRSLEQHQQHREARTGFGSACSSDGLTPLCDDFLALRHPTYGNWAPAYVADEYCKPCDGFNTGVEVADVAFWLLSEKSEWIGSGRREFLLDGIKDWGVWCWGLWGAGSGRCSEEVQGGLHFGSLAQCLHDLVSSRRREPRLTNDALDDLFERASYTVCHLDLPEGPEDLAHRFIGRDFVNQWLRDQRHRRGLGRRRPRIPKADTDSTD